MAVLLINFLPLLIINQLNGYKLFNHLIVSKYNFSQQIVTDWNSLSYDVVRSPNVDTFKSNLDKYWIDQRFE